MTYPMNCALVTLSSGEELTFANCDADEYTKNELTLTNRATFTERIFPPDAWTAYAVYDRFGTFLYGNDRCVRVRIIDSMQGAA